MKKSKVVCIVILIFFAILTMVLLMSIVAIKSTIKESDEKTGEEESIEEMAEGGIAYDEKQLDNFIINIKEVTEEIEEKIPDKEKFNLKFKEYIYINGLVDAKNAVIEKWQYKDNTLYMIFKLDDINQTSLAVKVSKDNIQITEYNI